MARIMSVVLLAMAFLTAVAVFRSGAGAQERQTGALQQPPANEQQARQTDMMMQCPMMAGLKSVELFADSPTVLLAQAKELKLTDEQTQQLKQIQESARRQARELLTNQQREQLPADANEPLSMMEFSMKRMPKTGQSSQQMCPMCMRMMRTMQMREAQQQPARQQR